MPVAVPTVGLESLEGDFVQESATGQSAGAPPAYGRRIPENGARQARPRMD
jgi:hypothetical protein